jgi:LPXTG-motif cell wall-anchored protein
MARRSSSLRGLRPLALAVVVTAVLLVPAGLSAQAAEDTAAPTTTSPSDPTLTAPAPEPTPAPVGSQPTTPPPPSDPAPTAVTVSRAGASASKSVSIVDFAFNPGSITVNAGDTVQWTNNGKVPEGHDVTGDGLDSGLLKAGESYSHTFNGAGTFSYICSIHPSMKGSVKVLARTSGSSGDTGSSGGGTSGESSSGTESESAAVSSPDAAGSSASLPATGEEAMQPAMLGLLLLSLGFGLRFLARRPRRSR